MEYDILIKALERIKQDFPDHTIRDISESGVITIIKETSSDISNEMLDMMIDRDTGKIIDLYDWYAGIQKSN